MWWRCEPMSIQAQMEIKLKAAFSPERLDVINESRLHAGHQHIEDDHIGEFDGAGETHFRVRIVAVAFSAMSRVERHRAVNAALADELKAGVHALAVEPAAPGEMVRW